MLLLNLSDVDKYKLKTTMEAYTTAYHISASWGFNNKTWNKIYNHRGTYAMVRQMVPNLPSGLVQAARDVACENLKMLKNKKLPRRKIYSAMRYNRNVLRFNFQKSWVSIGTTQGRIKTTLKIPDYFNKYINWKIISCVLKYEKSKDRFYLGTIVECDTPHPKLNGEVLGIDRGLINLAVCSNNKFFNSSKIRNVRGMYEYNRAQLQAKDTRSAKRKLKALAGREKRFTAWENHRISKTLANMSYNVFALEDLSGINGKRCWNKKHKRNLKVWPYWSLEQMLKYKAEDLAKTILFVDPQNTSIMCSKCGHTSRKNRAKSYFKCIICGYMLNADLNASRNIARSGKSGLGRLLAHKPNASSHDDGMGPKCPELRCKLSCDRKAVSPRCFGTFGGYDLQIGDGGGN
jgi:IS605 OrfB family transposase